MVGRPPFSDGGGKAEGFNWTRADMTLALFHKEPLSQARRLAWGPDKWLCCGVWEADEGGVQGPLWGAQQAQHVFIPSQNRLICEPTPAPGHLDLGIEAGTRWPVSKGLTQTAPSPSRGSTRTMGQAESKREGGLEKLREDQDGNHLC